MRRCSSTLAWTYLITMDTVFHPPSRINALMSRLAAYAMSPKYGGSHGVKIGNASPLTSAGKGVLNRLPAEVSLWALGPFIGQPIRAAEHLTFAVREVRQRDRDALMKRDTTGRRSWSWEDDVSASKIDMEPVEP